MLDLFRSLVLLLRRYLSPAMRGEANAELMMNLKCQMRSFEVLGHEANIAAFVGFKSSPRYN